MTPKDHGAIRGRRDLLFDTNYHVDLCGRFDLAYDPKKVTGTLEVNVSYLMTSNVMATFVVGLTLFMTPKGHDDLCFRFINFMTPKITVNFLVGLT